MRPHGRHAIVSPTNPEAFAQCDRCGDWWNRSKLSWQYQWSGTHLYSLGVLVCPPCLDVPFEQLRTIILPPDPPPVLNARPPNFTFEETGPVQGILASSSPAGSTTLTLRPANAQINDASAFVVGNYIWIQLNIGTFAQEQITNVDPVNNILTIASPLPALAPVNGTITVQL